MRSVAGYVTNNNRKRDRKEAQKWADKNLKEENLNRLLILIHSPIRKRLRTTPIAAKSFHETANPLFDARYPFTLLAKPSINIKNSIDNGNFDYSERSVRGYGGDVLPFHGTDVTCFSDGRTLWVLFHQRRPFLFHDSSRFTTLNLAHGYKKRRITHCRK